MPQKFYRDKTIFKYPCPVCDSPNQLIYEGGFDICGVCGWEDISGMRENPDNEDIYAIFLDDDEKPITLNKARKMWASGKALYPEYPNPKQSRRAYQRKAIAAY